MSAPKDVSVDVKPVGATGWNLTAKNDRDTNIKLLWDESSFIDSTGRSYGRLFRGQTKVIDSTKPQMPSVIAPHSMISEVCVSESAPEWKVDKTNQTGPGPLPDAFTKGVARMVIVFEIDGKQETWEGALSFDGTKPPPPTPKPAPEPAPAPVPKESPTMAPTSP